MRHAQPSRPRATRNGLSLVEVLATFLIVAIATALVLPAILHTRSGPAKRMTCMNNLRNLSLAVYNYSTTYDGRLPLLASNAPGTDLQVCWAVTLMPLLDHASALDHVARQPVADQAEALSRALDDIYKVYTCPDDPNHFGQRGGLSYAANIGYGNFRVSPGPTPAIEMAGGGLNADGLHAADNYSWSGESPASAPDKKTSRATGVFWLDDADGYRMTMEAITNSDGTSQTIMLTENLHSGGLNTWVGGTVGGLVDPRAVGFGLGIGDLGLSGKQEYHPLEPRPLSPNVQKYWRINATRRAAIGRYPAPSSMHAGVVNISFCDGSARALSETIDLRVYGSLLTPGGVRQGELPIKECGY